MLDIRPRCAERRNGGGGGRVSNIICFYMLRMHHVDQKKVDALDLRLRLSFNLGFVALQENFGVSECPFKIVPELNSTGNTASGMTKPTWKHHDQKEILNHLF